MAKKEELEEGMQIIEDVDEENIEYSSKNTRTFSTTKILSTLKNMLKTSIYEDDDYKLKKDSVTIDLSYDSKYTRHVYFNEIRKRFPGMVSMSGTKITVSTKSTGSKNDQGSRTHVKENRWDEKGKKNEKGSKQDTK